MKRNGLHEFRKHWTIWALRCTDVWEYEVEWFTSFASLIGGIIMSEGRLSFTNLHLFRTFKTQHCSYDINDLFLTTVSLHGNGIIVCCLSLLLSCSYFVTCLIVIRKLSIIWCVKILPFQMHNTICIFWRSHFVIFPVNIVCHNLIYLTIVVSVMQSLVSVLFGVTMSVCVCAKWTLPTMVGKKGASV